MRLDTHSLSLLHFYGDVAGATRDGRTVEAKFGDEAVFMPRNAFEPGGSDRENA